MEWVRRGGREQPPGVHLRPCGARFWGLLLVRRRAGTGVKPPELCQPPPPSSRRRRDAGPGLGEATGMLRPRVAKQQRGAQWGRRALEASLPARRSPPVSAMAPGAACRVSVLPEPGPGLARFVAQRAAAAGDGRFALGLSGGSLVELLTRHLPPAIESCPAAPARWLLAFCDERLVPPEHPDSTAGAYQARLLPRLPGPGPRVLAPSPGLAPAAAAADYAAKLRQAFPGEDVPVFDLLLLGIGPDGHTCSLFPGHPLLQEKETIVAAITDSPKPPPERITFTLPVLNAAKAVVFVATGEGKAAVVKRILEGDEENPLPAARVRPHSGQLCWILDEAAAKELTIPVENSIL